MVVAYERRGTGSPVVFVHGLGSRWQVFAPLLDAVAEHHEVIALDLPGFGATPAVPGVGHGPAAYAAWLAGWLQQIGVDRPHVVGSSMGGAIALELGRSGVAARVTAFAPAGFYRRAGITWTQGLLTTLRGLGRARPVMDRLVRTGVGRRLVLGSVVAHPGRVPPEVARDDVRALVGASSFGGARRALGSYRFGADGPGRLEKVPVTVAWGTRDYVLFHRAQSARARATLPFAQHVTLTGSGHLPFRDDPAGCARLVLT